MTRSTDLPFDVPAGLYPFEHRFLDLADGGRLHYSHDIQEDAPAEICAAIRARWDAEG